ncbi:hypothetical protein COV04_01460 [Candidatus Uhrbacteria bacterium CG10_big_fil_rev_8_21_14_0_10_48_11]|uniref:Uncharacterized protein n=1 Tax=Candidatus Uhrbacteria bacterium CG10_big_fil_rev_8_21_14_0_10_48_11 TaxID=1975037 RepID=A0A2M8LFG0_9BACT|nr:MAG: hypothetical protein COV04_01460 [Candidatus Uhrbacteria bacterium CG10_big_fil_rev_8_21_14_0_10_48_11]
MRNGSGSIHLSIACFEVTKKGERQGDIRGVYGPALALFFFTEPALLGGPRWLSVRRSMLAPPGYVEPRAVGDGNVAVDVRIVRQQVATTSGHDRFGQGRYPRRR